ncbi:MAG: hypothetical protein JWM31_2455, partial [Solirubrobacterales bacterium]|nr:hypothetical protein [Solirubrobacterales bacterium]
AHELHVNTGPAALELPAAPLLRTAGAGSALPPRAAAVVPV